MKIINNITREQWYRTKSVIFEIVKQIRNREVGFLGETLVRCVVAPDVYSFEPNLKRFNIYEKKANIYKTLAKFDFKIMFAQNYIFDKNCFSFSYGLRKKQMNFFNDNADNYLISYDLGLDFDAHEGNTEKARKECCIFKDELDRYKVPYSLKSSGSGFHIDIKHENLPEAVREEKNINMKIGYIREIVKQIYDIYGLKTLDIGIDDNDDESNWGYFYDTRRLWKVAYSWDIKTDNIALPLSDDQFNNFNSKILKPDYIIKNINLFNRGLLEREGKQDAFENMLNDIGVNFEQNSEMRKLQGKNV